ncbi:MAG: hypothetical protein KC448_03895 [Yoonia sp.]|nr:hypothetical protein [Yoonia sp.]
MVILQACTPPVPASNAGPGFKSATDFAMERARRDAALAASGSTTFTASTPVQTGGIGSSDLAAAGIGQAAPIGAPLSAMTQTVDVAATAPALAANNGAISDEQDFDAVANRESIASDAQRRAAQAAVREQVQPTTLPTRPANTGPNIVEYALNAPNRMGQEWYSRSIFATQGRFQRNCVKYMSPDAAQRDFLASGGPDRDRKGLDPDGDGFACGWDPAPFLLAAGH